MMQESSSLKETDSENILHCHMTIIAAEPSEQGKIGRKRERERERERERVGARI